MPCAWSSAKDQYASQWAAIGSIAAKIGCTAETLRKWVRHIPPAEAEANYWRQQAQAVATNKPVESAALLAG